MQVSWGQIQTWVQTTSVVLAYRLIKEDKVFSSSFLFGGRLKFSEAINTFKL